MKPLTPTRSEATQTCPVCGSEILSSTGFCDFCQLRNARKTLTRIRDAIGVLLKATKDIEKEQGGRMKPLGLTGSEVPQAETRCDTCEYKSCELDGGHACLPGDPFDASLHVRACHPFAKIVSSTWDYSIYECPICGTEWKVYEDDMK